MVATTFWLKNNERIHRYAKWWMPGLPAGLREIKAVLPLDILLWWRARVAVVELKYFSHLVVWTNLEQTKNVNTLTWPHRWIQNAQGEDYSVYELYEERSNTSKILCNSKTLESSHQHETYREWRADLDTSWLLPFRAFFFISPSYSALFRLRLRILCAVFRERDSKRETEDSSNGRYENKGCREVLMSLANIHKGVIPGPKQGGENTSEVSQQHPRSTSHSCWRIPRQPQFSLSCPLTGPQATPVTMNRIEVCLYFIFWVFEVPKYYTFNVSIAISRQNCKIHCTWFSRVFSLAHPPREWGRQPGELKNLGTTMLQAVELYKVFGGGVV